MSDRLKKLLIPLFALMLIAAACTTDDSAADDGGDTGDDGAAGSSLLQTVIDRGTLRCGVSGAATAFSETQADGSTTGFDADFCRAVAAAVLGDSEAVEFSALTAAERFTAVQTGAIDVLMRNTTFTQSRDTEVGMDFGPTTYYDGQQVMGRSADGITAGSDLTALEGLTVCTNAGTTTELNVTAATQALGVSITLQTFEDFNIVMDQFLAGACDAVTTDGSGLVGRKATQQPDGEEWIIFPAAPISKEPLGPVYPQNDSDWGDVINWVVYASIIFDEQGVTMANASDMKANPPNGEVERLLGGEGELQSVMGLDPDAFFNMVSQVGNYAEIYNRNLNPVGLVRDGGPNASFAEGGLIYAPPAR